jgi:hypothetical protein
MSNARGPARNHSTAARRPELAIVVGLGIALIIGVAILGGVLVANEANRDWYVVASVNGQTIDRGTLRNQLTFEEFLYQQQLAEIKSAMAAGHLSSTEAGDDEAALAQSLGDPVETARNDLVDEALVGQLAQRAGVSVATPDPWASLATFLGGALRYDLRWIDVIPDGTAPAASDPAVIARAKAGLAAGTPPASLALTLSSGGQKVSGSERWVGTSGPLDGVDDQLLTAARTSGAGTTIGPFSTREGDTLVGYVAAVTPGDPGAPTVLAAAAAEGKVRTSTVQAWAVGQALQAALSQHLLKGWLTVPSDQVRGQEFVVGPAAVSGSAGPWVDLVALDPSQLDPSDLPTGLNSSAPTPRPSQAPTVEEGSAEPSGAGDDNRGAQLANWLRSQPATERLADVLRLAAAANAHATTNSNRSGELGYLTQSQVAPSVGAVAFAAGRSRGDVVGPIDVGGRTLILYVEGRYGAELDDRSAGALTELQAPGADDAHLSAAFAPDRVGLARDSGWWSTVEFDPADPTKAALFGTAIGSLSDPTALDGDLALFRPVETRTALPDPEIAGRLTVEGYANWFAGQRAAASIILAANPLPEAYPSASPGSTAPPTPLIPGLPGSSVGQPSANPFAVPTLPGALPGLPSSLP